MLQSLVKTLRTSSTASSYLFPMMSITGQRLISSKTACTIANLHLDKTSGLLKVLWSDRKLETKYHPEWLRFNCQCDQCRQPHSNQRILDSETVSSGCKLRDAVVEGNRLQLRWMKGDHDGYIDLSWLKQTGDYAEWHPELFQGSTLPRFDYEKVPEITLPLYQSLLEHGFAIVYNLPTTAGTVKEFVEKVFRLPVQRTIYGEIFDVKSTPNPINVAYSNAELKPHIDLAYYESPPGLQLLHCLKFDETVQGGESVLMDGFHVAQRLYDLHHDLFQVLALVPATFEKIHFDRAWPVYMRYRRPHIAVNDQTQITGIFWAPQFEGPLFLRTEFMDKYYEAYRVFAALINDCPERVEFRLRPGEMVVFNNRRMLHGRKAFSVGEGSRHFQGCYVNIDEFKSQAQVVFRQNGLSTNVPHVANQSC